MARVTTYFLLFLLLLNGSVAMMEASGLSEDLDVTLAPGVDSSLDKTVDEFQEGFSPTAGLGETLFSLFIGAIRLFETAVNAVWAAPQMLMNLGFPAWIVVPVAAPIYIVSTLEIVSIATGRRTT
jgi:hypothetical protein